MTIFIIEDIKTGAYGYVNLAQDTAKWIYHQTKNWGGFDPSLIYRSEVFLSEIAADMWEAYYKENINRNWKKDPSDPYFEHRYKSGTLYWTSDTVVICK